MTSIAVPRPIQHHPLVWMTLGTALLIAGLVAGLVVAFAGSSSSSSSPGTTSVTNSGVTTGAQYYTGYPCPGNPHDKSC